MSLDANSATRLAGAHPLLRKMFTRVADQFPILILDSQRGKAAQEKAFKAGNSKAHFGDSAHNWAPSVALDVAPKPLDWDNRAAFIALSKVVLPTAKALGIPIRWGGDWNMNGVLTDEKLSDLPHYELHPWRDFAKRDCVLFGTKAAPKPAPSDDVLRLGDSGPVVKALQEQLRRAGFAISTDGDFGPKTEAAVRELQRRSGLKQDGVAGPKTRAALSNLL